MAVSFAATVLADLCRKGSSNVFLGTCETEPDSIAGPASEALLREVMCQLAEVEAQATEQLDAMLDQLLGKISSDSEIVLISTRPVDLGNAATHPTLHANPHRRAMLKQILSIDTSSDDITKYYQAE